MYCSLKEEVIGLIIPYDRQKAVEYAHKWALKRNPRYFDFEKFGGDCTNFASQVIYAGSGIMNYTPIYGWYYIDSNRKTASWTGVNYLYNFLISNKGPGPFAEVVEPKDSCPGDIVQLSFVGGGYFNHSPVIVEKRSTNNPEGILVAAHTDDVDYYPLTGYNWVEIRFIHIIGVRQN